MNPTSHSTCGCCGAVLPAVESFAAVFYTDAAPRGVPGWVCERCPKVVDRREGAEPGPQERRKGERRRAPAGGAGAPEGRRRGNS